MTIDPADPRRGTRVFNDGNILKSSFKKIKPYSKRRCSAEFKLQIISFRLHMKRTASLTVPLKITISLDEEALGQVSVQPAPAFNPAFLPEAAVDSSAGMAAFRANEERPYYDDAQDEADRTAYYKDIDFSADGEELFRKLSGKLSSTHTTNVPYKPSVELYPWVDLQPDRSIQSIYSGVSAAPEEFIRHDDEADRSRQAQLTRHLVENGASFAPMADLLETLEASLPYNCEHSVPQSWFSKKAPMRGDLHHLFACETRCNSSRGNQPYFESPAEPGAGNDCGISTAAGFEPKGGKGAVARATLYFLLRYPSVIGDFLRELQAGRLPILIKWHQDFPVTEYELHRNQAIFQRQGNRNPLIDHPELADRIAFERGFGRPQQS